MKWLDILLVLLPVVVNVISTIIHVFVFHRLKCTKNIWECMKSDFVPLVREHFAPPSVPVVEPVAEPVKQSVPAVSADPAVSAYELLAALVKSLQGGDNNGNES